jgi:hypothetical protein
LELKLLLHTLRDSLPWIVIQKPEVKLKSQEEKTTQKRGRK